jgi:hypothetical protein
VDRISQPRSQSQSGLGVRIVPTLLPTKKSPWLNAIEPQWIHSKRARLQSPRDCLELLSSPTESAGSSVVRITSISPFPRRSPECALGRASVVVRTAAPQKGLSPVDPSPEGDEMMGPLFTYLITHHGLFAANPFSTGC